MVRPRPYTGYTNTVVYPVHGRVMARVHGRPRPCTDCVQYTTAHVPRTWSVRDPITAVYASCTRPCTVNTAVFTARVHGIVRTRYTAVHEVYGPYTGRVHGASTAVYRVHVHGRVPCTRACLRPVYMAREWPCTRSVHGCERPCGRATAVYTSGKHACVHDRRVRTGRDTGVCTGHGRTMCTTLHGGVHGPYTVVVMCCHLVRLHGI